MDYEQISLKSLFCSSCGHFKPSGVRYVTFGMAEDDIINCVLSLHKCIFYVLGHVQWSHSFLFLVICCFSGYVIVLDSQHHHHIQMQYNC